MLSGEWSTLRAENPLFNGPLSGENPHSMTLATEEGEKVEKEKIEKRKKAKQI